MANHTADPTTTGKKFALLFPSPFFDTTQFLCLSGVKENKSPGHVRNQVLKVMGMIDKILRIKSAKCTKHKADTFVSVKNSNYSFVS